jgi:hypothetical protein
MVLNIEQLEQPSRSYPRNYVSQLSDSTLLKWTVLEHRTKKMNQGEGELSPGSFFVAQLLIPL